MTEYWADFTIAFEARDADERDEILKRLAEALQNTEWKLSHVECTRCEEA